jgi:predicted PurR-regulated permease PerM
MNFHKFQVYFFTAVMLGVLVVAFDIFLPYLTTIVLAFVLATVFYPMHRKLNVGFGDKGAFSALISTIIVINVVVVPIAFLVTLLIDEVRNSYFSMLSGDYSLSWLGNINGFVQDKFPFLGFDVSRYTEQAMSWVLQNASAVFSSVASGGITLLLSFLTIYYFFKDGEKMKQYIMSVSPLVDKYDKQIFDKLGLAVMSVIQGSLTIALIQGVLAGVGFLIFGIPSPIFWGAVAAFCALVPSVGTALVLVPAVGYLVVTSHFAAALGLAIWGAFLVGFIDNVLSPKLIERKMEIHPLLILFSVLGGIQFFGVMGFVLGPLVISLLVALIDIYQNEFKQYFEEAR